MGIFHTCLTALRNSNVLKLTVVNGMKWPEKPRELDLHQLEEVDFKENGRPLRVLNALHWLVNNSELYKKSGIVVDDNWFQEVTESAEDTVREFLEVTTDQTQDTENKNISVTEKTLLKLMAMILIGTVRLVLMIMLGM